MRLPEPPAYYSVNHAYFQRWSPGMQRYLRWLQGSEGDHARPLSSRYIGSLVADFHRNLLRGGIFCYPAETNRPDGKIRLLYEASPLAFLAEQAGGYASNGYKPVLDIEPTDLHQRTPLFVGNRSLVDQLERYLQEEQPVSDLAGSN
jgi:fructose-1,6-bisphosphatase I